MQAVVLAGGLATRLGARALAVPKLLLPIAGQPFAHWLLGRLRDDGYDEVLLCIGHLGAAIRDRLGSGETLGVRLRYSDEGDSRLGTAGALRLALGALEQSFLVTYGDSYLPFDYAAPLRELCAQPEALGCLAVYRNDDQLDRSNVRVVGDQVVEYCRPSPGAGAPASPALRDIDYGAMALRREVVSALPPGTRGALGELQADLARRGLLRALRAAQPFFEIGSEAGLARLEAAFAQRSAPRPRARPGDGADAPAPGSATGVHHHKPRSPS